MNTLSTKSKIFGTLIAATMLMSTTAKADQLVSLETAVEMIVTQQSRVVINELTQQVANSIEQEIANFDIDSLFTSEAGVPTVTISEIAKLSDIDSSEELPK